LFNGALISGLLPTLALVINFFRAGMKCKVVCWENYFWTLTLNIAGSDTMGKLLVWRPERVAPKEVLSCENNPHRYHRRQLVRYPHRLGASRKIQPDLEFNVLLEIRCLALKALTVICMESHNLKNMPMDRTECVKMARKIHANRSTNRWSVTGGNILLSRRFQVVLTSQDWIASVKDLKNNERLYWTRKEKTRTWTTCFQTTGRTS
jgi:hypothetical protein